MRLLRLQYLCDGQRLKHWRHLLGSLIEVFVILQQIVDRHLAILRQLLLDGQWTWHGDFSELLETVQHLLLCVVVQSVDQIFVNFLRLFEFDQLLLRFNAEQLLADRHLILSVGRDNLAEFTTCLVT